MKLRNEKNKLLSEESHPSEDRQKNEKKDNQLYKSKQYIEAILNAVRDPILILNEHLYVISATKAFYKKFNTTPKETEGKPFYDFAKKEWSISSVKQLLENFIKSGKSFSNVEIEHRIPSYGSRFTLINAKRLMVDNESLIFLSFEDITERKKEKKEWLENKKLLEDRVKLAVDATALGTWEYKPEEGLIILDKRCREMLQVGSNEPVNYKLFLKSIYHDDLKKVNALLQEALKGVNNGVFNAQLRLYDNEPSNIRWVQLKGQVYFNRQSNPNRFIGSMLDITGHKLNEQLIKESEERFRIAADSAPVMIWMSGRDNLCNYFNKSWLHFRGHTFDQEAANGWKEGVHPDDSKILDKLYTEAFKEHKNIQTDYRLQHKNEEYRWVSNMAVPRYSGNETFEGYIGIVTDIHDQKLSTEELEKRIEKRTISLKEAIDELVKSNQNLEEFAYAASHDLQEPLRKIQVFANRLQEKEKDNISSNVKLYLDKITSASNRMSNLIDDLLNYSRLTITEGNYIKTDLDEILKNVQHDLELLVIQKKAILNTEKLCFINAVPMRMHQLFSNLINNALKFSKKDEIPQINITSAILTDEEKWSFPSLENEMVYCQIIFADNGIGFKEEFAEKIFTLFQRLHGREEYPGTGIGLSICRKIVTNHKGLIYAKSKENEGSEFHVILPVEKKI